MLLPLGICLVAVAGKLARKVPIQLCTAVTQNVKWPSKGQGSIPHAQLEDQEDEHKLNRMYTRK